MKTYLISVAVLHLALTLPASAQDTSDTAPQIDYEGFAVLTQKVAAIRQDRLLSRADFLARAQEESALILDTRSRTAYAEGHLAGAVNLPFSDFNQAALKAVIGDDKGRPILIYCNNNFSDNVAPVPLKKAPLALNIPTFVNLIGYGYTNVWELGETVSLAEVDWVSGAAPQHP